MAAICEILAWRKPVNWSPREVAGLMPQVWQLLCIYTVTTTLRCIMGPGTRGIRMKPLPEMVSRLGWSVRRSNHSVGDNG